MLYSHRNMWKHYSKLSFGFDRTLIGKSLFHTPAFTSGVGGWVGFPFLLSPSLLSPTFISIKYHSLPKEMVISKASALWNWHLLGFKQLYLNVLFEVTLSLSLLITFFENTCFHETCKKQVSLSCSYEQTIKKNNWTKVLTIFHGAFVRHVFFTCLCILYLGWILHALVSLIWKF